MPETKVSGPPYVYPAEFYESGEAMPDLDETLSRYSPGMQDTEIARLKAMMAQQKQIEPVLKYFVASGYRAMNKVLHGQAVRKQDATRAKAEMAKLDAVLLADYNKSHTPTTVWRGITADFAQQLTEALKSDGLFSDPGYVIVSSVERQTPYLLQIELPAGTPRLSLNKFLINEVLLPRGSRFQAVAHHELPQGKVRIVARWLGA